MRLLSKRIYHGEPITSLHCQVSQFYFSKNRETLYSIISIKKPVNFNGDIAPFRIRFYQPFSFDIFSRHEYCATCGINCFGKDRLNHGEFCVLKCGVCNKVVSSLVELEGHIVEDHLKCIHCDIYR